MQTLKQKKYRKPALLLAGVVLPAVAAALTRNPEVLGPWTAIVVLSLRELDHVAEGK